MRRSSRSCLKLDSPVYRFSSDMTVARWLPRCILRFVVDYEAFTRSPHPLAVRIAAIQSVLLCYLSQDAGTIRGLLVCMRSEEKDACRIGEAGGNPWEQRMICICRLSHGVEYFHTASIRLSIL